MIILIPKHVKKKPSNFFVDINEAPVSMALSSMTIPENSGKGAVVGSLFVTDKDRTVDGNKQQHTFQLILNPKGLFRINIINQLEIAVDNKLCLLHGGQFCELNFEDNRLLTLRIRATDNGSPKKSLETTFNVELTNINESPRHLRLSNAYLKENATIGHHIGKFTFQDEDMNQLHNITLVDDDQGRFTVDRSFNLVKLKETNYETESKHLITVLVEDNGNPPLSVS